MHILLKTLKSCLALSILIFAVNSYSEELEITPPPTSNDVQTAAKQAILVDFNTDTVLFEKNANTKMFPSSMTKVLTMYLVFDQLKKGHIDMDTKFTVSEKAWRTGGSQMFLEVNSQVSVSDLNQGVIVQSGNDACVVLAEGIAGSVEQFVKDMNGVAKELGMENTHFVNPDGLPTEGHYTTAKDLSIIARRLITDFPEYYHYYSQKEFTYNNITQPNRNKLLNIPDLAVDGMKTGYTEMGGYGMIATGVNKGRRLIAVVNGLQTENDRLKAAAELLRYGYNNFRNIKLYSKQDIVGKVRVWGGIEDYVAVVPNKDIEILLNRRDYNFENYKIEIAYKEPWDAPVKKDTYMANLIVKNSQGKVVKQFPLYASKDIAEAGFFKKLYQKIKYLTKF